MLCYPVRSGDGYCKNPSLCFAYPVCAGAFVIPRTSTYPATLILPLRYRALLQNHTCTDSYYPCGVWFRVVLYVVFATGHTTPPTSASVECTCTTSFDLDFPASRLTRSALPYYYAMVLFLPSGHSLQSLVWKADCCQVGSCDPKLVIGQLALYRTFAWY